MTNRKIKGNMVQNNLRAREFWDCSERILCSVWLALLSFGISKKKILEVEDDFHETTIRQFRQDADDDVIDVKIDRFMDSVGLTNSDTDPVIRKYEKRLAAAFPTNESYSIVAGVLRTDLKAMLYQLHVSLGYGNKRLNRVISFVAEYEGDAKAEVQKEFNIYYPDPDTLPDTSHLYLEKRKRKTEIARANAQAFEMLKAHIAP